jgi:hypothetical protein
VPQAELPADISAQPEELEPQDAEAVSSIPSFTDSTAPEPLTNETESTTPFPETTGIHTLSEEQLPTQTVLDNLFNADPLSPPEFLAQLSDFGVPALPEMPAQNVEAPSFHDTSTTIPPVEEIEAPISPDAPNIAKNIDIADAPTLHDMSIDKVEAPISPDAPNIAKTIDIADAPTLHDMPTEKTEATTSPDISNTIPPIDNAEAHTAPNTSNTTTHAENVEVPISSYSPLPIFPMEGAEALGSLDIPNAKKYVESSEDPTFHDRPTEKMQILTPSDIPTTMLPVKNVEAQPSPDTSTPLPLDLPDQIRADLIDTNPTSPKLKAKRKRKASQLARSAISMRKDNQQEKKYAEERLSQEETQPEQPATQPTQEQTTPDSDSETE